MPSNIYAFFRYDLAVYLPVDLRSNTLQSNTEHLKVQQLITGYKLLNRTGTLKDCKKQQVSRLCNFPSLTLVIIIDPVQGYVTGDLRVDNGFLLIFLFLAAIFISFQISNNRTPMR